MQGALVVSPDDMAGRQIPEGTRWGVEEFMGEGMWEFTPSFIADSSTGGLLVSYNGFRPAELMNPFFMVSS